MLALIYGTDFGVRCSSVVQNQLERRSYVVKNVVKFVVIYFLVQILGMLQGSNAQKRPYRVNCERYATVAELVGARECAPQQVLREGFDRLALAALPWVGGALLMHHACVAQASRRS